MSNTRTAFGSTAQLAAWIGAQVPAETLVGTTLNTKLGIQAAAGLGSNETSRLLGMCIGVGGLSYSTGTNGRTRQATTPHQAIDGAAFEMLPFCIREVGNDLSAIERQRYALRRIENISGVDYIVYYMRRMNFRSAPIKVERRTTVNGTTTPEEFEADASVLSPVPTVVSVENVNPLEGISIVSSARLSITLDAFDVNEIIQAAMIKYGSENDAYITEVQLMQGVERSVEGPTGAAGGTINYNEVICAQVGQHITSRIYIPDFRDGYSAAYELGGTDPMFMLN